MTGLFRRFFSKNLLAPRNLVCPVCLAPCSLLDVVDFNKSCEELKGEFLELSGIPIYYAICENCGFCFSPEIAKWKPIKFKELIYNAQYILVDPEYLEIRPKANAANCISLFGDHAHSLKHLDYGGGNGRLSEILNAANWQSISYDPFVDSLHEIEDIGKFDIITAFEVFEHVPDPRKLISNLCELLADDGLVFFSTLVSEDNIKPNQRLTWWYASPRNGHISLFSKNSLEVLAHDNGLSFESFSTGLHVFYKVIPPWAVQIFKFG